MWATRRTASGWRCREPMRLWPPLPTPSNTNCRRSRRSRPSAARNCPLRTARRPSPSRTARGTTATPCWSARMWRPAATASRTCAIRRTGVTATRSRTARDCGPRYTITHSIPYDRATTSMSCFPLCPDCAAEYNDPLDRRFHAQPNACPVCGPKVWLASAPEGDPRIPGPELAEGQRAIERTAAALRAGNIVAVKGLGGFHLVCDATSAEAIALLRERKCRPHKSLAIMVPDLETARCVACVSDAEAAVLASSERPIVVLASRGVLPPAHCAGRGQHRRHAALHPAAPPAPRSIRRAFSAPGPRHDLRQRGRRAHLARQPRGTDPLAAHRRPLFVPQSGHPDPCRRLRGAGGIIAGRMLFHRQ